MSGVATPPIVTEPFGLNAGPAYITLPIPVPSQILVTAGAASFNDGFPPLTMTPLTAGGIPPSGKEFNGILYTATAWCAFVQAGQIVNFDTDVATALTGYKLGAVVQSVLDPTQTFTNVLDGNTNDPDVDTTGWVSSLPLYAAIALSGVQNNYVLPGPSDYAIDFDTTAGALDFTGFVAQRNGQRLYLSNTGANLLQALANNVGSAAANRVRNATDLALVQNQTLTIQWFAGISLWLLV